MVGHATAHKLHRLNINTIGDLANYDLEILKDKFKSHGQVIWNYANGIDYTEVRSSNYIEMKGIGNSTTIAYDVEDKEIAHRILLCLCETVAMRLRNSKNCCRGGVSMKVLAQPIEVISYTDNKGDIRPLRFRLQVEDESLKVIKVDKVISKNTERLAGNNMTVFKCKSVIDDIERLFEIKYDLRTCRWVLYKI